MTAAVAAISVAPESFVYFDIINVCYYYYYSDGTRHGAANSKTQYRIYTFLCTLHQIIVIISIHG